MDQADTALLGRGWAVPVAPDPTSGVARAASEADSRQALLVILGTERGERVMRPGFGVGLRALVFEPPELHA